MTEQIEKSHRIVIIKFFLPGYLIVDILYCKMLQSYCVISVSNKLLRMTLFKMHKFIEFFFNL